jgi:hypothetical protein
MSPLILVTVGVILIATPLSVGASAFCWSLYREDRTNGLALVLASVITVTTLAGVLLAIPTIYFVLGRPSPLAGLLVLVAIDILLPAPVVIAAYLRWLRRGG